MKTIILVSTLTALLMSFTTEKKASFYAPVAKNIEAYAKEFDQIPEERKKALKKLALFVETKVKAGEKAELIFICTHNSRRSHISQIWAQTAAAHYGVPNVIAYSGGTEATAFNPRAVKAMEDAGFKIKKTTEGTNPVYEVRFADDAKAITAFSKKYDGEGNPKNGFGAVMTCSHADHNCPVVAGATVRIATPYDDPKDFDGTPQEAAKYAERVHEIGREILYAFSLIKA
jgi:arsenate reductase (thioredoxin)